MARLSPALSELRRRFRKGFELQRTGGGHYRVKDPQGRFVEYEGKNLTLTANPSPGVMRAIEEQLTSTGVLKQKRKPVRLTTQQERERRETLRRAIAVRAEQRQAEATALRDRLVALLEPIGAPDVPGFPLDLGLVAHPIAIEQSKSNMTPDLLSGSARRVLSGAWVEPRYQEVWYALIEQLERAPDVVGEWYNRVRDVRGLPADSVQLRIPDGEEWPFRVELLPLSALLVDDSYQRPPSWTFVRREAARFDPALVGTIDVAQRSPSRFAILDGQQRSEIVRLVGKTSIWASVYVGLDLPSEARFFLHKNRDRKTVHPYYTFRARLAGHDPDAVEIEALLSEQGYKIAIGAAKPGTPTEHNIAAIAAVEIAYKRRDADGRSTLGRVLSVLKRSTFGRANGQNSVLIRGLSLVFIQHPELQDDVLVEALRELGPDLLLGRAHDLSRGSGGSAEFALARVLSAEYNRRVGRTGRLKLRAA